MSDLLLSFFTSLKDNHIKSRHTLDNFLLASHWSAMESPDWEQILEMLPVGENEDLEDKRRLPFFSSHIKRNEMPPLIQTVLL